MHAEKSNFSIVRMARLLEVSRAGFYQTRARTAFDRAQRVLAEIDAADAHPAGTGGGAHGQ